MTTKQSDLDQKSAVTSAVDEIKKIKQTNSLNDPNVKVAGVAGLPPGIGPDKKIMARTKAKLDKLEQKFAIKENIPSKSPSKPVQTSQSQQQSVPSYITDLQKQWNITVGEKEIINIWVMRDAGPEKVPSYIHGIFYTSECYVILIKRPVCYQITIWFGRDTTLTDRKYALTMAQKLTTLFTNVVVTTETNLKETETFRQTIPVRVTMLGKFMANHTFKNKIFYIDGGDVVQQDTSCGILKFTPKDVSQIYWGESVAYYIAEPHGKYEIRCIDKMVDGYNLCHINAYGFKKYDKYVDFVYKLKKEEKSVTCKLYFVGDDGSLKHAFTGPKVNQKIIRNPKKIFVIERYVNDELFELT